MTHASARGRGKLVKGYDLRAAEMARLKGHEPPPVRRYFICPVCAGPHARQDCPNR